MSEEEFSKCGERGRKNISVEFRVFEKKGIERKVPERKKNQSVFGENFFKLRFSLQ